MTGGARRRFDFRAFWSVLLAATIVGLPWTGIVLHAAGHAGDAGAVHGWMAAHWALAVLFTSAALGHLVLNGRALVRHLRGLVGRAIPVSREALTALAITAALLALAVGHTALDRGDHGRGGERRAAIPSAQHAVQER